MVLLRQNSGGGRTLSNSSINGSAIPSIASQTFSSQREINFFQGQHPKKLKKLKNFGISRPKKLTRLSSSSYRKRKKNYKFQFSTLLNIN